VTGGGIHPVAQRIADLTGGEPFDGFKSSAPFEKIAVAVIDCGGTARIGVYPMKNVLTVDIHATSPAGPLAAFIKETNFVSGVSPSDVTDAEL
jgi:sorbitol-specific phosphotransferase system component IIBC